MKLDLPEQAKKKEIILKAVRYIERMLIQSQNQRKLQESVQTNNKDETAKEDSNASSKVISIDPKTYCKLGHFHLLLEDYSKGMFYWNCDILQLNLQIY